MSLSPYPCVNCNHGNCDPFQDPCTTCLSEPNFPNFKPLPIVHGLFNAADFLQKAAALITDRGKERDQEDGERSMSRCVNTFNAMTGHNLSEEDGWLFMVYLKHARMRGGKFKLDDYEDAIAYEALMTESAVASGDDSEEHF